MTITTTATTAAPTPDRDDDWWRSAVVYQVYPRSFADADGDGVGDIAGLRARLPYIASLGVDAIWINPWYPSPMADAGYDVADYRDIEPVFGSLADAEALLAEAHEAGLKVLLDMVPNHTSDQHAWFQQALAAAPGSRERARYIFREGRGPDGTLPPNDWESQFGGPAWTRTTGPDGTRGQWYLHLFAPGQPDVDWRNPEVRAEFEDVLRFWFDRGVDGFRIDVAHGLAKHHELLDVGELSWPLPEDADPDTEHPFWDRADVHEIYRAWRAIADSYTPKRVYAAEAWVPQPHRLARYLREDELHTAFNFDFLVQPWLAAPLRETIDATLAAHATVGAPATWVLSNHDVAREVSRYARPQDLTRRTSVDELLPLPADFAVGLRRARAAALLLLALPGGAYVYQGEELGLPEVEDIPVEARQDPTVIQTNGALLGRDGCRVPLPWSSDGANAGFSPAGAAAPWLPQPEGWAASSVEAQDGVAGSTLELFRRALALRHAEPALGEGVLSWLDLGDDTVAFRREPGFACVVNLGAVPVALPEGELLVASGDLAEDGTLPTDTTVWLRVPTA